MKNILEYLDANVLHKSTEFVVKKLNEEPSYNFFNDPIQKQILDKSWKDLLTRLHEPTDEESILDRNRQKLAFKICNYHNIIPENTIFDENYVFSEQYVVDRTDAMREAFRYVWFSILLILRDKDNYNENSIEQAVFNLLSISNSISVPIPRIRVDSEDSEGRYLYDETTNRSTLIQDDEYKSSENPFSNYNIPSSLLGTHFQMVIKCDEQRFNAASLKKMFDAFRIDRSQLFEIKSTSHDNSVSNFDPQPDLPSGNIYNISKYLLDPLYCFLQDSLNSICRFQNVKRIGVRAKYTIAIIKDDHSYHIPFEIKSKKIFGRLGNGKEQLKDPALQILANRIIFQLMTSKSRIGFAIDLDCVVIVGLDENAHEKVKKIKTIVGFVYEVPCSMKCFRFSESKYSVSCLIMMLIKDYLANINKEYEHHVVRLFDKLQMTEQDKVMNERCQAEFAYLEFASKHINYHQNDKGDYIHNIYPSIIIPQNSYKVLDQMRDRNFECSYHFRHVYPYFVSEFGHCHIYKSRYCPTDTKYYTFTNHQSRGLLSKNSFLKAYSHTLRVFLSEIRTYRELYNVSKSGILYNYAVKYTRRGCTRSCLPSYKYGRCAWNNKTNLCGFYITVKYKVKDSVVDSRKRPLEIIHDYNPDDSFKKFVRFVDSYLTVHRFKKYFEKDNQTELIKGITSACELDIAKIIHPPPTIDNQIFKRRKIDV